MEREPHIDYFDVVNKLAKRFDIKDLPETIQMHFGFASQSAKETLIEWSDRVVTMAMRAFSDLSDTQVYKQAILKFCQGCLDKEAGLYALNQRPDTVEEAVDRIRWFQHTNQAIYGKQRRDARTVSETWDGQTMVRNMAKGEETKRRVQFQESVKPTPVDSQMSQRVDKLEKLVAELVVSFKSLSETIQRRSRSPARSRNRSCFNCGEEGHWRQDCPKKGTQTNKEIRASAITNPLYGEEEESSDNSE